MTRTTTRAFVCLLLAMSSVGLYGCNVVSGSKSLTVTGTQITQNSLSKIELGKTSEEWLIGAYGQPTAKTRIDRPDGTPGEIWRYRYEERESSSGELLFVYSGWENKVQITTTCFEISKDHIVTSYWVEKSP